MNEETSYQNIQGILLPKAFDTKKLHDEVNLFIDCAAPLLSKLEKTWASDDRLTFSKSLLELEPLLEAIYAKSLALDAQKMIRASEDFKRWSLAKQGFKPFMADVASLSVALQKAQKRDPATDPKINKVELFVNTSKSVATVGSLLEDGMVEPAKKLLQELVAHHKEVGVFENLLHSLNAGKVADVQNTVKLILQKFNKTLDELVGTDLSKCIMAVDDMPEILTFVNSALKNYYKVVPVPSAQAALAALSVHKPDLFILDIEMPEMSGLELATSIRALPEHTQTPIIFLTGNANRDYITEAMALGGDEFIIKPASHGHLVAKVSAFLTKA